jgi:ATP-dependent helicase/nuclease subunit B
VDDASLTVNGKVDRVDGWVKDGKLYLRVVDYKSGKKAFDLSDVRHGLNIQMLLYLFALEREGKALFSEEIVPAGVLYLPARDVLIHAPRGIDNTKLRSEMDKELRRSGMVLDKPEVLNAMEHGVLDGPRFLPIALDKEGSITKGVATAEELGKLGRYVDKLLERIAREMRSGNIDADPCGRGENDNVCMYCEFASACHFADLDPEEHLEVIRSVKPEDFWRYVDETIGEEADA